MPNYPITCPWCKEVMDSKDSVADSLDMYREHLKAKHPGKELP
jgi:hypothetical protein